MDRSKFFGPQTAADWYWLADDGRVFSSRRIATVSESDADYRAWLKLGFSISSWPRNESGDQTTDALQQVLSEFNLSASLDALKEELKTKVDAAAEKLRLRLITPGSGQAMEYQEAYAQAQAALTAGDAVKPEDYPMLTATIGVDIDPDTGKPAKDVLGVARSVKAAYEGYLQAGAAIRGARLLGKAEVEAASDAVLAQTVFAAIKWPAFS